MRRLIKNITVFFLGSASQSVSRRLNYIGRRFKDGYFSINQLDRKLEQYVDYDDGFFVELGANDGVSQSNSLYFEIKRNWRGVLIEPTPHNFLLCKEQRSSKNKIFCNACVSFEYREKYVDIKYANLMSISENLELDIEDKEGHIASGREFLSTNEDIFSFGAVAATLTSILRTADAPREIDFLSLDVEGAELEVLKGLDFDEFSFKFLLIEVRDIERMENFLSQYGYYLEDKFSVHDYLFKRMGPVGDR